MQEKHYKFVGVASSDLEYFCIDVNKETFKTITGREPDGDASYYNEGLYIIRPTDLLEELVVDNGLYEFEIIIKTTKKEKY